MESVEENFPRGGSQKKPKGTAAKRPREDDNLFSTYLEDQEEVKKKKKDSDGKPKTSKPEKIITEKDKSIELLDFKSINVGMLFLGCVKTAKDFELSISLPYGLTGYVQATNVCEAYTKLLNEQVEKEEPLEALTPLSNLYSPGMLVRCAVSSLGTTSGGYNSIKLSLNPKLVNAGLTPSSLQTGMFLCGCVSSVEDHGYLIDLGIGGTKAFLHHEKAQVNLNQTNKVSLRVGQYLNCVIDEVKNDGRIVRLSMTQSDVTAAIATEEQKWTLNNLLPGLVVKAQIRKVLSDCVTLSFLSSYTGSVDFLHLESKKINSYKKDKQVKACVLWIDRSSKTIRLTLRKCFLQPGSSMKQLNSDWVGTIQESCTVKALHKNVGAVFEIDGETLGFAFAKKLPMSKTLDSFKEGTVHTGRVVGFSPMDEILLLSFQEDVLEGVYLRLEDVQVGQVLEGTVNSLTTLGMVVDITKHLNGLVPTLHLADVTLKNPEKKYKQGNKIKCRVLDVDPSARKLILTRKKIMINSELPILATYHDATPGLVTHGFISAVKDYGCIVKFYNDVHGLAPLRELSSEYLSSPEDVFYKGQVVKVRVLKCNPEKETLLLSFKIVEEENEVKKDKPLRKDTISEYGKIVDVKIISKVEDGLQVLILPEESPAFLPKSHLSDHISNCELLWHCLQEDDQLTGVMILSTFKGRTIVTKKAALISFIENTPVVKNFSEVHIGMLFTGFVKNVMPYGIFVELPYGLVGLVPISNICDKFVTNISDHFVVGQTVVAKVTNLDEDKKRFLLTLKMSECAPEDCSAESFSRLSQCLKEIQFSRSLLGGQEDPEDGKNISSLVPGKKLTLVVEEVEECGLVLFNVGQISGAQKISADQHEDKANSLVVGQKAKVVVLHVDLLTSHVHVSVDKTLLKKTKETVTEGTTRSAVVQHVAEDFAIVSLEDTAHLAAIPRTCHYNDTYKFESENLHLGQEIFVIIKSTNVEEYGLLLAERNTTGREKRRSKTTMDLVSKKSMIGELITGTVEKVKPTSVMVSVTDKIMGAIHASQILEDVPVGVIPTSKLRSKQTLTCRVIGGRDVKTHKFLPITHPNLMKSFLELSILPSLLDTSGTLPKHLPAKMYLPGEKVTCYVTKYNKQKQHLEVEVTSDIRGQVEFLSVSNSIKVLKCPEKHFKHGQALSATIIGFSSSPKKLSLTLIDNTLTEGCVTHGLVKAIDPASGLKILLVNGKIGRASLFHLGDCYADSPVKNFTVGMIVRCCILSLENSIEVSLRKSRTCPEPGIEVTDKEISSIDDLKEGQLVSGFVGKVTDKWIIFRLSNNFVGFVPFNRASRYFIEDHKTYSSYIPEGTLLTAKILSIKKKHVELSLLPKDTGKPDIIPESESFTLRTDTYKRGRKDSESGAEVPKKKRKQEEKTGDDEDSGVEVYCREKETEPKASKKKNLSDTKPPAPRLQVSSGFSWDVNINNLQTSIADGKESSSDSEDDEEQSKSKKTKKDQQKAKKETQAKKETAHPNQQLQSVHEFERLVISSPNVSANWIQYMDFYLQSSELEQARSVGERALQTIYFREEQEKLNVWVAMLNMENTFGTEETLHKVFERAIQYNDPLKAFQHMVDIYIKSEKFKEAEELFNTMVKRFRQEKSVWWKYATFLLKQGQSEETHGLLQRALKCVPEKEHVDLISKFAQLEFRMGDAVRAKALFESTLSSYPKRTDLWSVYIDMVIKHGSQKEVRDIFERVIHLSLAPKRIKFFFKRYLEYEKKHGNEKTVQTVKEKALQYVESKGSITTT